MKKIISVLFLVTLVLSARAADYSASSYTLSSNGAILLSWTGNESSLDFTQDSKLKSLTGIGYDAFRNNKNLTSVVFPEGLKTVGSNCLGGCTSLTRLSLPSTMTYISSEAFSGCTALAQISCNVADLSKLYTSADAFSGIPFATCRVVVPTTALVATYKAADTWKQFTTIVSTEEEGGTTQPSEPVTPTTPPADSSLVKDTIQPALDTIPNDWQNDLRLNSSFREMKIGESYTTTARRLPEIIDNPISNQVTLPKFHYTLVSGNSVSVSSAGVITATALGTSIIKVTYDSITANGKKYGAVSPVNATYMAVQVMSAADSALHVSTNLSVRPYDTYYFFGSNRDLSFTVKADNGAKVAVKCNNTLVETGDSIYTVKLQNRANIVEVAAQKGEAVRKIFYIIDGRKVELSLKNLTDDTHYTPVVGDKVQLSFRGITLPVYKLATIYNPQMESPSWGDEAAKIVYNNRQLSTVRTNVGITQYELADKNTIELTLPESGEYTFTGGHIAESWWGSKLGTDLDLTAPGAPNLSAPVVSDNFSQLPAFRIQVAEKAEGSDDVVLDLTRPTRPAAFEFDSQNIWAETYTADSYNYFTAQDFSISHLLSANNWGGSYWDGFTVSRSTDNSTAYSDFKDHQWGCMAQGGVKGKGTPCLIGFYSAYNTDADQPTNQIIFNGKTMTPQGVYACNTSYTAKCIEDGFFVARAFTKGDTYTLTAEALGDDSLPNGKSISYLLADYCAEKEQDRLLTNRWEWFDLTSLGACSGISFSVKSSDSGDYGDNTADYFALDRLVVTPATTVGIVSQAASSIAFVRNVAAQTVAVNVSGQVRIYDTAGRLVYSNLNYTANQSVSVAQFPVGTYVLKVGNRTFKFLR